MPYMIDQNPQIARFILIIMILFCIIGIAGCTDSSNTKPSTDPSTVSTAEEETEENSDGATTAEDPKNNETEVNESEEEAAGTTDQFPGIHINLKKRFVDLDAKVIRPTEEWLELLACTPGTLDHETIMTVPAKPSHVHVALMLLKMKPGKPRKVFYDESEEKWKVENAFGPKVKIFIVMDKDGETVEIPANEWVIDRKTGKVMKGNEWMFTGSRIWDENLEEGQKPVYLADVEGTVISLVHFHNEVMARDNDLEGGQGGGNAFDLNAKVVPEAGTMVKIRIRPVEEKNPADETGEEAGDPES